MIALKEKSKNTAGNVVKLLAGILPLLVACVIFVCTMINEFKLELGNYSGVMTNGIYRTMNSDLHIFSDISFYVTSNLIFLILWAATVVFKIKKFSLGMIVLFCISILKMIISFFFYPDETALLIDYRYWLLNKTWIPTIIYLVACCCGLAYMILNFVLENKESESRNSTIMLALYFSILCIVSDVLAIINFYAGGLLMSEGTFIGFLLLGTSLIYARLQDKIAA